MRRALGRSRDRSRDRRTRHSATPEFTDHRIERHHLGGEIRRNADRLARGQDVELVRIEHDARALSRVDRVPEIERVVGRALVDVDHAGMAPRAPAHLAGQRVALQVGRERKAALDVGRAVDQTHFLVQALQLRVTELRRAVAKPQLS